MEKIDAEDELYRRIFEYHHNPDTGRIASSAFMRKNKLDPEVSVYLARLSDPAKILTAGLPRQKLVALKAAVPRAIGLDVLHQPTDEFYGHCLITGFGSAWKEQCARLAEAARLVDLSQPPVDSARATRDE